MHTVLMCGACLLQYRHKHKQRADDCTGTHLILFHSDATPRVQANLLGPANRNQFRLFPRMLNGRRFRYSRLKMPYSLLIHCRGRLQAPPSKS